MTTRTRGQLTTDMAMLKSNLLDLVASWRRRANAADRGGMVQIAMDYNDCADELNSVIRGNQLK